MTLERWERAVEWPLIVLSICFLAAYSVQVLGTGIAVTVAGWFMTITWVAFVLEYLASLWLAPRRLVWFFGHLHELALVALPMLRPLRLLRLVTLIGVLQRFAGSALRGRVVTYVVAASGLLVYLGALAMYEAEKYASDASIRSFGDTVWWAIVTITTVGYGDLSPTTTTGRIIAVGLMMSGIALLGIVTATLASWLVDKVAAEGATKESDMADSFQGLHAEMRELREELARGRRDPGTEA